MDWIPIGTGDVPKLVKLLLTVEDTTWDGETEEHVVYRVYTGQKNVTAWAYPPAPYKRVADAVPEV